MATLAKTIFALAAERDQGGSYSRWWNTILEMGSNSRGSMWVRTFELPEELSYESWTKNGCKFEVEGD